MPTNDQVAFALAQYLKSQEGQGVSSGPAQNYTPANSQDTQTPQEDQATSQSVLPNPMMNTQVLNNPNQDEHDDSNTGMATLKGLFNPAGQAIGTPINNTQPNTDQPAPSSGNVEGPTPPEGFDKATGPKLVKDAPVDGLLPWLLGQHTPGLSKQVPMHGLIPMLLGLKQNIPVDGTNYYQAAKGLGVDKYLPSGLPQLPDGTPLVSKDVLDQSLREAQLGLKQNAPTNAIMNKQQLLARGMNIDDAATLSQAYPNGITEKAYQDWLGMQTLGQKKEMTNAMQLRGRAMMLNSVYTTSGAKGLQDTSNAALKNVGLINRAQQLVKIIEDNGGVATQPVRAELAAVTGTVAGQNNGVLTDERMQQYLPQSAKAKFGNLASYWTNEFQPVDFSGFLPQFKDILDREKTANQFVAQSGNLQGLNVLATQFPEIAETLRKQQATNPLYGAPQMTPTGQPLPNNAPAPRPIATPNAGVTPDVQSYADKYHIPVAQALQIKLKRLGSR